MEEIEQLQRRKISFIERFLNDMRGRASPTTQADVTAFLCKLDELDSAILDAINAALAEAAQSDRKNEV